MQKKLRKEENKKMSFKCQRAYCLLHGYKGYLYFIDYTAALAHNQTPGLEDEDIDSL